MKSTPKNIVILGSTGSIGRQAVEVVLAHPEKFKVTALAARSDGAEIARQAAALSPDYICLVDSRAAAEYRRRYGDRPKVLAGYEGIERLCALAEVDVVLNGIVGSAGLRATIDTVRAGKQLALANKESMVCAGELVNAELRKAGTALIPVDSEHNAVWQCLIGEGMGAVERLILTASGGPFRDRPADQLDKVTPEEALAHPRWSMGKRITIDSATMMNKGFEVIEAHFLFNLALDKIDVLIHPQSIVHSMVEFVDGSIKAQLGPTDMRFPILYSLAWPSRLPSGLDRLDLAKVGRLDFCEVDVAATPCLRLAYEAAGRGGSYPAALNAADEVAVEAFLARRISFNDIGNILEAVVAGHEPVAIRSIADFELVDAWARAAAGKMVQRMKPAI